MDVPIGQLGAYAGRGGDLSGSLAGFGQSMSAPIGGYTNPGGYLGTVGDSRTFSALSPRAQSYMQAGSPGNYGAFVDAANQRGMGMTSNSGFGNQGGMPDWVQRLFEMLQQQRTDYSKMFETKQSQEPIVMTFNNPQPNPMLGSKAGSTSNVKFM
jgi:hypothetical protein